MTWCNTSHWNNRASWADPNPVWSPSVAESCCGSEYPRRARCGKTARRDLCGGCWATGSPTAILNCSEVERLCKKIKLSKRYEKCGVGFLKNAITIREN